MVRVKICGIRSSEEAKWAIDAGADAIGFVFVPQRRRYIRPEQAREISLDLPPFVARVGVFVNEDPAVVAEIVQKSHLTTIQLHGNEALEDYQSIGVPCIKAINISIDPILNSDGASLSPGEQPFFELQLPLNKWKGMLQGILVDSSDQGLFGGTGSSLPWDKPSLQHLFDRIRSFDIPLILAGGLTPENIQRAIHIVNPYAVDVSSGVERVGAKHPDLIKSFLEKAKAL
jgi:phosphoribosylanthranilate isomerase